MIFLLSVLETLSSLCLHAKKKRKKERINSKRNFKILPLTTAQRILPFPCTVRVSVVLRPHADAVQVTKRLEIPQFILRVKMTQLSCSFGTNCKTQCYFSCAAQEGKLLHTFKSVGVRHRRTFKTQQCVPNVRFVREAAYYSYNWPFWRLLGPRFHDVVQISCTSWYEMQTLVIVIASIVLMKIGDVKLRET